MRFIILPPYPVLILEELLAGSVTHFVPIALSLNPIGPGFVNRC